MSDKKILLFDFDGVIVDSLKDWHEVVNEIEPEPIDLETFRSWHNGNVHELDKKPEEMEGYTVSASDLYAQKFHPRLMGLSPIEQVHAIIPVLAEQCSLSVVTSSTSSSVNAFLEKHNIRQFFQHILGADVHYSKTRKIRDLLKECDAESTDALFVTDTLGDIREAEKAGVQSIAVT